MNKSFRNIYLLFRKSFPKILPTSKILVAPLMAGRSTSWTKPVLVFGLSTFITVNSDGDNTSSAPLPDPGVIIKEADQLMQQLQFSKAKDLLINYKDSNNEELLWRLAKAIHELSKETVDSKTCQQMVVDAFHYIGKAMAINEHNHEVHKWMAIIMDTYYKGQSTKARLQHVVETKEHMIRAAELEPKDPHPVYMLGWWYYTVADMHWSQRQIATILFGSVPKASFDEALNCFTRVMEISEPEYDSFNMNLVMLAKSHMKLGNKEYAVKFLQRASESPAIKQEDKEACMEATQLLHKLGVQVSGKCADHLAV